MRDCRKETGSRGEKLALDYLRRSKYKIRETNFRCSHGEIDIVAEDNDYLVFVEVRTRSGSGFGTPEESITQAKKNKLISLALSYIQSHDHLPSLWRIDVIAVELDRDGKARRIELIENAIQLCS